MVAELTDYLGLHAAQFDLIVAMDALSYFGELSTVFRNAAHALRPEWILRFHAREKLMPTGRAIG